jgi:hypothetical protein
MICPRCNQPECNQCAICGEWECCHHEFSPIKRPKNCVCASVEWRDPTNIPPVCNEYKSGKDDRDTSCVNCEHDKECHK